MSNIKVGDTLRRVEESSSRLMTVGNYYKVVNVFESGGLPCVQLKEVPGIWYAHYFETEDAQLEND